LIEIDIEDGILIPTLIIEMPPLDIVDGESLGFHRVTEQVALPALA
jgi:hypothetical protein